MLFGGTRWCSTCQARRSGRGRPPENLWRAVRPQFPEPSDGVDGGRRGLSTLRRIHDLRPDTNGGAARPGSPHARVRRIRGTPRRTRLTTAAGGFLGGDGGGRGTPVVESA